MLVSLLRARRKLWINHELYSSQDWLVRFQMMRSTGVPISTQTQFVFHTMAGSTHGIRRIWIIWRGRIDAAWILFIQPNSHCFASVPEWPCKSVDTFCCPYETNGKIRKLFFEELFASSLSSHEDGLTKYRQYLFISSHLLLRKAFGSIHLWEDVITGFWAEKTKRCEWQATPTISTINEVIPSELSNCLVYRIASISVHFSFRVSGRLLHASLTQFKRLHRISPHSPYMVSIDWRRDEEIEGKKTEEK